MHYIQHHHHHQQQLHQRKQQEQQDTGCCKKYQFWHFRRQRRCRNVFSCPWSVAELRLCQATWTSVILWFFLFFYSAFLPKSSLALLQSPNHDFLYKQRQGLRSPLFQRQKMRESLMILHVLTTPESIIEQASTQKLLDDLIDESVRTSARRPIMMQFDPSSGWIWNRWKGTVFSETWDSCVSKMAYASIVFFICKTYPGIKGWLSGFNILWGQLLSVTTFTLTFFVNQSYALWRKCYELSRRLQGRLHDLDMTLAAHAVRKPSTSVNEPSTYTAASRQILELVSRYVRLFNLLTYASFTRSHRPVLTPRGMRRLVERGLLTAREREVLVDAEIPATQRHNAVLLWIIRTFVEGREAGHFLGGAGFEEQFLEKVHVVRAQYGSIGDELQGRMPLAYAHIVQVLVDIILWMYPFMAFSSGMSGLLCVLGTGILTVSYQGLFDLAKQFLDPYDNESYGKGEDPLVVDTLIAETNAGSVRWMYGLEEYPVSAKRIEDGELSEYLLPLRGYSVQELEKMEDEKLQKEKELNKKRNREEEEKRKVKQAEQRLLKAAEAMKGYQINQTSAATQTGTLSFTVVKNETITLQGVVTTTSLNTAKMVTAVLDTVPTLGEHIVQDLVPNKTASAYDIADSINGDLQGSKTSFLDVEAHAVKSFITNKDNTTRNNDAFEGQIDNQSDEGFDDNEAFEFEDDLGTEGNAVDYDHTFDPFNPYKDLPWHDEVGPDGKEVRLSQLLADEVWDEEIAVAKSKETIIRTYEEYAKKVAELADAEKDEFLEKQRILLESPGDQSSVIPVKDSDDNFPIYDQTKLDGISQLWGLRPDDLSQLKSYEEPPLSKTDGNFREISQLWNDATNTQKNYESSTSRPKKDEPVSGSFDGVAQLWGQDLDDPSEPPSSSPSSGSRRVSEDSKKSKSFDVGIAMDGKEVRLSQILADEVWDEEFEATRSPPTETDDYTQQANSIKAKEQGELLETAAILNAPPGADMVEVPDMEAPEKMLPGNFTEADDNLDVLEMDGPTRKAQKDDVDDRLDKKSGSVHKSSDKTQHISASNEAETSTSDIRKSQPDDDTDSN